MKYKTLKNCPKCKIRITEENKSSCQLLSFIMDFKGDKTVTQSESYYCKKCAERSEPNPTESLSPKEKKVYEILEDMIDRLYENNVDVSYFPNSAKQVLVETAKRLLKK